jgi:bacterioferritin
MAELDKERTVYLLNRILESELAGVVRYTHYSLLVFGHNRIPIEEYARQMVYAEELHASEVDKMLRKPGKVAAFRPIDHLPGNRA